MLPMYVEVFIIIVLRDALSEVNDVSLSDLMS